MPAEPALSPLAKRRPEVPVEVLAARTLSLATLGPRRRAERRAQRVAELEALAGASLLELRQKLQTRSGCRPDSGVGSRRTFRLSIVVTSALGLVLSLGLARAASFSKLCHTSCGAALQACSDAGTAHCRRDVVRRCRQEGVQVCMSCDTVPTPPTSSALAKLCRTTCGAAIDQCTKSGGTRCRRETIRDCRQSGLDTCLVCTTTTTTTFPGSLPSSTLPPGVTTTTFPDCNTVKVMVDRGDCGPISSDPPGVFNCSGACTSKTFTISAAADDPTLIGTPKNGDTDVSWDGDCYDDGTVPLEFAFLPNCTLSCTCLSVQ